MQWHPSTGAMKSPLVMDDENTRSSIWDGRKKVPQVSWLWSTQVSVDDQLADLVILSCWCVMYSGQKKKVMTSVTFQFCPAGPTVKLLHDRYTKQSTTFQFLKQLQLCAARINHTTFGILGVFFIYFYPCNQRFSKLFNSKKKMKK
jgi:hypothetical protein